MLRNLEHLLHLTRRIGKGIRIAAGCGAVHEARVTEEVGRAPKQLDARALLFRLEHRHHGVEIVVALLQRGALRRDVAIVEAVKRRAQFLEKLNKHTRAVLRIGHIIRARFPRADRRARPERVIAHPAHRVPIRDAEAQVLLHRFAFDHLVGVVMLESQRVPRIRALVFDLLYVREKFSHEINRVRAHWRQATQASQGKGGVLAQIREGVSYKT